MPDNVTDSLRLIYKDYGVLLASAGAKYAHKPEILAGIMQRETEGGRSKFLDKLGPEGKGDAGHGRGLMQIDDRSYPGFCACDDWKDPAKNINMAAAILRDKRKIIVRLCVAKQIMLSDAALEASYIAAYNCGEGNVIKSLAKGEDVDTHTAHGNYSADVLKFAEIYREIATQTITA